MKKILNILLAGMLGASAIAVSGCKDESQSGEQNATGNANEIVLADFEQWAPDFQLMSVHNKFGKISRNEDPKYVKSGKYSARLQPVGAIVGETKPVAVIPLSSPGFDFDYGDITEYEEVYAYMYNASDKDVDVTIGFSSGRSQNTVSTLSGETITLPAGQWKRVSYLFDIDIVSLQADVTEMTGIYFMFDDQGVMYPDDAPSIYVDDLTLVKAATKRNPNDVIVLEKTQAGNSNYISELLDFEKPYQKYVYLTERSGSAEETFEDKVVTASEYGIEATSGEKVLRILKHAGAPAATPTNTITIPGSIFEKAGMQDIPEEEWDSTYICFDYCYTTEGARVGGLSWWVFTDGMQDRLHPYHYEAGEWKSWTPIRYDYANSWRTFRYSLYELAHPKGAPKKEYVQNSGGIMLQFNFNTEVDVEIFLDNFRLEKGDKLNIE